MPRKGDVAAQVIEGAYEVLQGFDQAQASREAILEGGEAEVFARAALALKYDDLWSVFNRTQEKPHSRRFSWARW